MAISAGMATTLMLCAVLLPSCGGGGDEETAAPSTTQILLRDGDTIAGFEVGTVESAALAADRSVAVIASQPGAERQNAVFLIQPNGSVETILSPSNPPPDLSLTTVRNLEMTQSGEVAFEVGDELDHDGLFLYDNGALTTVARTEPGSTPPGFRITGELRVGDGGLIAFTDGTSPCEIDSSGGGQQIECTMRVHQGTSAGVSEVNLNTTLTGQSVTSIVLVVNDRQQIAVGMPARGSEPLIGLVTNGQFVGVLSRRIELPGLGVLLSARPRAMDTNANIVVDAGFDTDGDGVRDQFRVLLYNHQSATVTSIAESGVQEGNEQIIALRGRDIDSAGRVIYEADLGQPSDPTNTRISVRSWSAGATEEIAWIGHEFGKNDEDENVFILSIESLRVSRSGDVVFLAQIGRFDEGTRRIDRVALLRHAPGGNLEEVIRTRADLPNEGQVIGLTLQSINASGDLLIIADVRGDRRRRELLLMPRL